MPASNSIVAHSRGELECILEALVVEGGVIRLLAGGAVDTLSTYARNCKEAPAKHLIILPGFAPAGLRRDGAVAMRSFVNFCRSQFGQRRRFTLVLEDPREEACILPMPTRPCPKGDVDGFDREPEPEPSALRAEPAALRTLQACDANKTWFNSGAP